MDQVYNEIRAALHSIWHRRWLALAVAWGVCLVGWLWVALVPNVYESSGRIYVQLYDPIAEQMGLAGGDRQHEIDRVSSTLTSSVHLAKVIYQTRLSHNITTARQMEAAIDALSKNIRVINERDNIFEISATSGVTGLSDKENAALARDIVTKMINIFHDENVTSNDHEVTDTMKFLDQRIAQRQREIAMAEQRRVAFENAHPELAPGGVSLIERVAQDRAEIRGIDTDIATATSALAVVNGQLARTPQTGGGGRGGALAQAQADLAAMRARGLTDNHPDVIALRNQIATLRSQGGGASVGSAGGDPNPAYAMLLAQRDERQASLQSLRARRAALEGEIAQASAQQGAHPELISQAQSIGHDYDVLTQQYNTLLQNREALRLKGEVENAHDSVKFQIIDPPTLPRAPAAPNRPLLLVAVLVAGIAAGLGVAYGIGELRATHATTASLARVNHLPVLGAISEVLSPDGAEARGRERKGFFAAAGALAGVFVLLLAMDIARRALVA